MGSKNIPDPAGMVKNLTEHNMHIMVSVWSKFDKTTTFFKNMSAQGFMIGASNYYDVWNPAAREQFYQFSKAAHFDIGVDALWLDATEPEGFRTKTRLSRWFGEPGLQHVLAHDDTCHFRWAPTRLSTCAGASRLFAHSLLIRWSAAQRRGALEWRHCWAVGLPPPTGSGITQLSALGHAVLERGHRWLFPPK